MLSNDLANGDQFGQSVSLKGDLAVISARLDDDRGSGSGSVYVFQRAGSTWTQEAKLTASDGVTGDNFGFSVSFDGQRILGGAQQDDDLGSNSGSAYVFARTGATWTQENKLSAPDGMATAEFGKAVGLSGMAAVIGASLHDLPATDAGASYIVSLGCLGGCTGTADLDGDGDIDLGDYADLAGCLTGPTGALSTGCECADVHPSGRVDLRDFAALQSTVGGS